MRLVSSKHEVTHKKETKKRYGKDRLPLRKEACFHHESSETAELKELFRELLSLLPEDVVASATKKPSKVARAESAVDQLQSAMLDEIASAVTNSVLNAGYSLRYAHAELKKKFQATVSTIASEICSVKSQDPYRRRSIEFQQAVVQWYRQHEELHEEVLELLIKIQLVVDEANSRVTMVSIEEPQKKFENLVDWFSFRAHEAIWWSKTS